MSANSSLGLLQPQVYPWHRIPTLKALAKLLKGATTHVQSLSKLWTHLIFSTKDRYPFLSDKLLRADMHAYLATVLRSHDCELPLLEASKITFMRSSPCQRIMR